MPYKSIKQERWAHTPAGMKALGGKAKVAEWDKASEGKKMPMKVHSHDGTVMTHKGKQKMM